MMVGMGSATFSISDLAFFSWRDLVEPSGLPLILGGTKASVALPLAAVASPIPKVDRAAPTPNPCVGIFNLTGTFAAGFYDLVTLVMSANASGIESDTC